MRRPERAAASTRATEARAAAWEATRMRKSWRSSTIVQRPGLWLLIDVFKALKAFSRLSQGISKALEGVSSCRC